MTPAIHADDRVAAVLARDERLLDVLVSASPAFERLRSGALRRTMAKLVTVAQAARIAGVDADALVERLNRALDGGTPGAPSLPRAAATPEPAIPAAFLATPAERIVDLDVREELRAGREPFRAILEAARSVPSGGVLRLRAIFEPAPLYAVLGRQGFAHATEALGAEDFRVWFLRGEPEPAPPADDARTPEPTTADDVVVLDVRDLEPPEPMVRTLEALASLPRGKTLVQINARVPRFLLEKLEERGFSYEIHELPGHVRLLVRHR